MGTGGAAKFVIEGDCETAEALCFGDALCEAYNAIEEAIADGVASGVVRVLDCEEGRMLSLAWCEGTAVAH